MFVQTKSALLLTVILAIGPLSGCSMIDKWRGDGFQDDLATSGATMRPRKPESRPWFFSTKANEIDNHFGN